MNHKEREKLYLPMYLSAALIVVLVVLYYAFDLWGATGKVGEILDYIVFDIGTRLGLYRNQFFGKVIALLFVVLCQIVRAGKSLRSSWGSVLPFLGFALAVYFFPLVAPQSRAGQVVFVFTSLAGFVMTGIAVGLVGRLIRGLNADALNDNRETFLQCEKKVENENSIHFPTKYFYNQRWHKGWINIVNPFRAILIMGGAGSGKTFSVFLSLIEQVIKKGFSMFCYDYKYPGLTKIVYNTFLENIDIYKQKYGVIPEFCVLNFDDPRYSLRCNPLHPKYIEEAVDASEIAEIIWNNVNPDSIEKQDFFVLSAKAFVGAMILFLRLHQNGRFCTFPHLIELMGRDYKATLKMMQKYPEIVVQLAPFRAALKDKAFEQLAGQIASAQIPLVRFSSPSLYWVLSGNDCSLDVNDRAHPKILCVGNNPNRQIIYSTTMALYTSRLFRQINKPGKIPCSVILDELPTIFLKGLDNIINTAREYQVSVAAGAQDESQIMRDYKEKEAKVILNTVGTVLCGQVKGDTAEHMSKAFGREFREHISETTGGDNDTQNRSFQQQDILPQSRIETLSQGEFCGKVADQKGSEIDRKLFCGHIQVDVKRYNRRKAKWKNIPPQHPEVFNDAEIERKVRDNAEKETVDYLYERLMESEREILFRDRTYNAYMPVTGRLKVENDYREMNKNEKEKVLREVIEFRQKENVKRIVQENYEQIKQDIEDIFIFEGVDEFEEDENAQKMGRSLENNQQSPRQDPTQSKPMFPGGGSGESNPLDEAERKASESYESGRGDNNTIS